MRIAVSSDTDEPVARPLVHELRQRGHEVTGGRAGQGVVRRRTGAGASVAAAAAGADGIDPANVARIRRLDGGE